MLHQFDPCQGDSDDIASTEEDIAIRSRILSAQRELSGVSRTKCLGCDETIPKERREAVPGCNYCIKCQNSFDKNRHHRRDLHLSFDAVEESDLTPEEEEFAKKCLNPKD